MSPRRPKSRSSPLALIVEPNHDNLEMYAEGLMFGGLRVAESATAEDALEKARTLLPDVISTDIVLSGDRDGCELCEELKSDKRTQGIPVIAVTAWAIGGHLERARRAGFDSVLIKPLLPSELVAEMERLLKLSSTGTTSKVG